MIPSPARTGSEMASRFTIGYSKPESDSAPGGLEYVYLKEYFGYDDFRSGQHEVVTAAVSGRDVAVFWATGAGKSLCYQLPALQTGKTVIVVSPLISLMQDQVIKFNATVGAAEGGHKACFLGSTQYDPDVEKDALEGKYRLVYVTPEKMATSFLDQLKKLHSSNKLALIAIDEAHCISEWGHDFRPSYRQLRQVRSTLSGIPIMALTATAVPRVQTDIVQQLGLADNRLVSQSSFDRSNLQLSCVRKTGKAADLSRIAKTILAEGGSTIIYAPTQAETDAVATFLQERFAGANVAVGSYHAGKAPGDRQDAHLAFLSGKMQVIVATVAFGMGIDKPDIRRVVHYGPPKTVEEYFQQIGRAGRDGSTSKCELVCTDSDFANYSSEFYTKGLTEEGKKQMIASTEALRKYSCGNVCRRKWFLDYFGEKPPFGDRCGTCDICVASSKHGDDTHRDFRQAASPVLEAVASCGSFPQSLSQLLQILSGSWKGSKAEIQAAMPRIRAMREALPRFMRQEIFSREMFTMLVNSGHLERRKIQLNNSSCFVKSYDVYELTKLGHGARCGKAQVWLPVPVALRQIEEQEQKKLEARVQEIKSAGIDPAKLTQKELENEDSPILWYIRKLKLWRDSGKESQIQMADRHEELRKRILAWRDEAAVRLRMAPADVLAEHLAANITYVKPTSAQDLRSIGVRIAGVEDLAKLIENAKKELFAAETGASEASKASEGQKRGPTLCLPSGNWTPPSKWSGAIYKAPKNGKPPWEVSWERFSKGERIQAIASQQASGKPIQPSTVASHLMTSLQHGRPVDLSRFFSEASINPPDEAEWNKMEEAAAERNCNACTTEFKAKDLLRGLLGAKVDRDHTEKGQADKEEEGHWYEKIRCYEALKRVSFPVKFEEPESKRQKCA